MFGEASLRGFMPEDLAQLDAILNPIDHLCMEQAPVVQSQPASRDCFQSPGILNRLLNICLAYTLVIALISMCSNIKITSIKGRSRVMLNDPQCVRGEDLNS